MFVEYKGRKYPELQTIGHAAQFAIPFASYFCKGDGYDIGCNKKEWALPGAQPIDLLFMDKWHAHDLPRKVDYIFSSHCLEHIEDWVGTLNYWKETIKPGGVLFLYLPHFDQEYWRPWNNRKHIHILRPEDLRLYFESTDWSEYFVTEGFDLNHSFYAVGVV